MLDRDAGAWHDRDPAAAALVEAYEAELRREGVIDFDDMPLLALRALRHHLWLRRAILAKYAVMVVDEYQDLGAALHRMVMGLCFRMGVRLFAVGDVDQSIYGFTGANPVLLQRLADRADVETIHLRLNYRCGSTIVTASQYALGEDRGYQVPDGAVHGTVYFHPRPGDLEHQADHLFADVLPEALTRTDVPHGQVAILYQAAWMGDVIEEAARQYAFEVIRADKNALYPRGSPLLRWLELCAVWCCGGWRIGSPRFRTLASDGRRLFTQGIVSKDGRSVFGRALVGALWTRRQPHQRVHDWLVGLRTALLDFHLASCRGLDEERAVLDRFMARAGPGGDVSGMSLAQFAGLGDGADRINLSTLHSAKGREFEIVVLFGMDDGWVPRRRARDSERRESRRSFYVGFTRAKQEVHIMHSQNNPSPFVKELQEGLHEAGR